MDPEDIDKLIDDLAPILTPKVPFEALNDIMNDINQFLGSTCAMTVWAVISHRYPGYFYCPDRKRLVKESSSSED
jgi:hypothetical protein